MISKLIELLQPWKSSAIDEAFVANSQSFCMMPWVHFHVTQSGTITPCCQAPWEEATAFGNINEQSIEEIWQGTKMNDFRAQLMQDRPDERCQRCYEKEKSGLLSLRKVTNEYYLHHLDWVRETSKQGVVQSARPVYLDIRFSNVCNFRCRICGPWSSTKWNKDAIALGMAPANSNCLTYSINDKDQFYTLLDPLLAEVEEIYFAGGEPLVMEEHYELLGSLLERKRFDVKLRYSTNFSVLSYKDRNILQLWKQFETVWISASLDGMDERGEFQRKEQDWKATTLNRKQLLAACPHVQFMISPTVSVLNVLHLPDFHRSWTEQGLIEVEAIWPSLLIQPPEYNIRILPPFMKTAVSEKYRQHIEWIKTVPTEKTEWKTRLLAEFEHLIDHLQSEDHSHLIPVFREKCLRLDEIRGENTLQVFPELAPLFQTNSNQQEA